MGMDVILNQRIYLPVHTSKGEIVVTINDRDGTVPLIDYEKICSVSTRLDEFRGYEVAELLTNSTGSEFNGSDWLFGEDDARSLIEAIEYILDNPDDSSYCRVDGWRSQEEVDHFLEEIKRLKLVLEKALDNGADSFECLTWC